MGRETYKEEYPCGCIFEYSFDECCGMGAIPGTEKRQMIWCDTHRYEVQRLENTIVRAKRELNSIRYNIRAKKKQPKIDEEEAPPPEFGEPGFDMETFTAKAREWCTTILIPALDAARLEGKTFLEIPDDKGVVLRRHLAGVGNYAREFFLEQQNAHNEIFILKNKMERKLKRRSSN